MQQYNRLTRSSRPLLTSLILILLLMLNVVPSYAQRDEAGITLNTAIHAPSHLSPASNSVSTALSDPPVGVPTLQWSTISGATRYNIQISASEGFATTLINQNTVATSYTPKEVLADGTYFWRVRAEIDKAWGEFSDPWSFRKEWSAEGLVKPALLAPAHDPDGQQVITNFSPEHFSWEPVPGAAAYTLEISLSPTFNDAKPYRVTTLKTHHTPTTQFANNEYYWRVTPIDARDHAGEPSETREFTFGWNHIPELLTPDDNTQARFIPRFTWTAVPGASSYVLEISSQENFSALVANITTANTSYTPETSLANNTDYFWRVRAVSPQKVNGPTSAERRFRANWIQPPTLLSPLQSNFAHIYPYFSWTPVAGAESYQLQISESNSFAKTLVDKTLVGATAYTQPQWNELQYNVGLYWRVRALDAQDHTTNWSDVQLFRFVEAPPPNLVYPEPYYVPDAEGMPVHTDRTIAYPLFVWDTTHQWVSEVDGLALHTPDYYLLEVAAGNDENFNNVLFSVESAGLGAAPTEADPFNGLTDGSRYFWRVTPMRAGIAMADGIVWQTRIDRTLQQLPLDSNSTPDLLHPPEGFIAVSAAPVLGWLPVANAHHYEVQISQLRDFSDIDPDNVSATSDTAEPYFPYYVPWQGRQEAIPAEAYWWRVLAKNNSGGDIGEWSDARRFMIMNPLMTGNPFDYPIPSQDIGTLLTGTDEYDPSLSQVAVNTAPAADPYTLGALHVVQDRSIKRDENPPIFNLNWIVAFEVSDIVNETVSYALYFDVNQQEGVGATTDPRGNLITTDPLYRPEYVIYLDRTEAGFNTTAELFEWTGTEWRAGQSLVQHGGEINYDPGTSSVQLLFPYTTIILQDTNQFSGGVALTVYSMGGGEGAETKDSIPHQPGSMLTRAALFTDMPTPLYPFDTPLSNPTVFHELPSLRWRMPYANVPDGYKIEVARHADFTQETIIESWESFESKQTPLYGPIPTAFHSGKAYNDDESYYWRISYRHEEYDDVYDYGPWSQPMRFKLTSYQPGNPMVTLGNPAAGEPAYATPSFTWDRVEGAARYSIQIDNDFNMNSPLTNKTIDGNSFTALDTLADGTYYWRVAMRRTNDVLGQWTSIISFTKSSLVPSLISPINGIVINNQPTFIWAATITNTGELRIAAPRYRLQWDDNPQFNSPNTIETEATSFTPSQGQSLDDGTWFWRVAVIDGNGKRGPDSPAATFYKEYLRPEMLSPVQGSSEGETITFEWTPMNGAAFYILEIDENEAFDSPIRVTTDNTRYTHTDKFVPNEYYWRVQMVDNDGNPGPTIPGRFSQGPGNPDGPAIYMPFVLAPQP